MGYRYLEKEQMISFSSKYKKAFFGLSHISFLSQDEQFCFPIEDKDAIKAALFFYQKRVLQLKSYPVYNQKNIEFEASTSKEVLKQVLGIPSVVFDSLDLDEDIISQLHFKNDLTTLKKDCYINIASTYRVKWFSDDFKLYCLKNGFFFFYDETKPFIEGKENYFPVFIEEQMLSSRMRYLYQTSLSDRLAIDFLGRDYDAKFVSFMKKFDDFSFDRRLSYFVNRKTDLEIASLVDSQEYFMFYSRLLRQYLASLINTLYDQYCLEVLNQKTTKMSYLSSDKIFSSRYYCLSSFFGEMYSLDQVTYSFSSYDRERITRVVSSLLSDGHIQDILELYSKLSLPYEGFSYVKNLKNFTVDNVLSSFSFDDNIQLETCNLSLKRFDLNYSYLPSEQENRFVLFHRYLFSQGIVIRPLDAIFYEKKDLSICISCWKQERTKSLKKIFDEECSFAFDLLPPYLLEKKIYIEPCLEKKLKDLDEVSHYQAVGYFYSLFKECTLKEAIELLFSNYGFKVSFSLDLIDFFSYVLRFPFLIARNEYRKKELQKNDYDVLNFLDHKVSISQFYEPNLIYPLVNKGLLCYSFKKTFLSKPYLCSDMKEVLKMKIDFLLKRYTKIYPDKIDEAAKNRFVIRELGLPFDVASLLNPSKGIISQISFKDQICHRCLHSQPTEHEIIDRYSAEPYNVYLTYIRAEACKHGLFFNDVILNPSSKSFMEQLADGTYHMMIHFDMDHYDSLLIPYLNLSKSMLVSLLISAYPSLFLSSDAIEDLFEFLKLDLKTIKKYLIACPTECQAELVAHENIMDCLYQIFGKLEFAYALHVSKDIAPSEFNAYCLNYDYNARLPYPYVLLGRNFNAYTDDVVSGVYYFCECDREAMEKVILYYLQIAEEIFVPSEYKTPFILAFSGLPYQIIYRVKDYDLSTNDIQGLMSLFSFREDICRRCTNIPHCSFGGIFAKNYPLKDDNKAEYNFSYNCMVKEGVEVIYPQLLSSFSSFPKLGFDLDKTEDTMKIPLLTFLNDGLPEKMIRVFFPDVKKIQELFQIVMKEYDVSLEIIAIATGVVIDTCKEHPDAFLQFNDKNPRSHNLRKTVEGCFPQVRRVREGIYDCVLEAIVRFIFELYKNLFLSYALEEKKIGR